MRLARTRIAISMIECGQAWQNGLAGRFMRPLKAEMVYLDGYQDYGNATLHIGRFIYAVYNRTQCRRNLDGASR